MMPTKPLAEADPQIGSSSARRPAVRRRPSSSRARTSCRPRSWRRWGRRSRTSTPRATGKWYYGGCEVSTRCTELAIDRAKQLFGAEHANVQPHSGLAGQHGRVLRARRARRHDPRDEPQLRRAPHARLAGELLRQALQDRAVWSPGRRDHRHDEVLRLAREHRPKILVVGASAYRARCTTGSPRSRARSGRRWWWTWPTSPASSRRGSTRCRTPRSSPRRRTRVLRAPSRRAHPDARGAREGPQLADLPGIQGGPLEHVIAAKAVAFHEALQPSFKEYQRRIVDNAQALAEGSRRPACGSSPAAPTITSCSSISARRSSPARSARRRSARPGSR